MAIGDKKESLTGNVKNIVFAYRYLLIYTVAYFFANVITVCFIKPVHFIKSFFKHV